MAAFDPNTASEQRLRKYLADHSVDVDMQGVDRRSLRAAVVRHMKRLSRQARRSDPLGPIWGADTALSVSALKDLMVQMRTDMLTGDRFEKVIFKLDDISDDMVVLRHSEDCRSKVRNGMCQRCREHTDGVWCFAMDMLLQDTQHADVRLELSGFAGVGRNLFGSRSAREVHSMTQDERDDIIDAWTEVPILAKCALSLDTESDTVKCRLYDLKRLRDEWLNPIAAPVPVAAEAEEARSSSLQGSRQALSRARSGATVATESLRNASGLGREMIEGEEAVEIAQESESQSTVASDENGARSVKRARKALASRA